MSCLIKLGVFPLTGRTRCSITLIQRGSKQFGELPTSYGRGGGAEWGKSALWCKGKRRWTVRGTAAWKMTSSFAILWQTRTFSDKKRAEGVFGSLSAGFRTSSYVIRISVRGAAGARLCPGLCGVIPKYAKHWCGKNFRRPDLRWSHSGPGVVAQTTRNIGIENDRQVEFSVPSNQKLSA